MILQLYAPSKHCWHSLSFTLASLHTTKAKQAHTIFFTGKKFHPGLVIVQMLIMFFTCEKNHLTNQNLCSLLWINFFFHIYHGVNLCLYTMYDKPTYIHTHYKKFGLGEPFTVSKYTTKISSPTTTSVGDHSHICIKLKTGQVDKSYM